MDSIIEIQYFPCQSYFHLLSHGNLTIEQWDHYQKRTLRNKCVIAGANGPLILTIPLLKGKHQQQPIRDTKISYAENWQHQHLQSILSAYGKAPYFEHYIDDIAPFFDTRENFLFDLNIKILERLEAIMQLPPPQLSLGYLPSSHYEHDFRDRITPHNFQLMLQGLRYPQVFSDRQSFIPNLSILDLLFCTGPEAGILIRDVTIQEPLSN